MLNTHVIKYRLQEIVELPVGAEVIHVDCVVGQSGLYLFVATNPGITQHLRRRFVIVGEEGKLPENIRCHVGSVRYPTGSIVHVYEVQP